MLRRAPVGPDGLARIAARQIYILPTGIGLTYGTVALSMLIGSLNYQNNLGLLFAFFMISVGLVAMHHCWFNLLGMAVQARAGPPTTAGSPAQFEVCLQSSRAGPRYDLRIVGGVEPVRVSHLPGPDQTTVRVAVPTSRRGWLVLKEVEMQTRHPMGLFSAWSYAICSASVLVYPKPAERAPPPGSAPGDGRQPGTAGQDGADDFLGPREYRLGDSTRRVDWKAAARERGLVVKQFGGDLGLEVVLDWSQVQAPEPERRIALLARQVLDAELARLRFGLRLPGLEVTPDRGEAQVHRCLAALALFDYGQDRDAPVRRAA